MRTYVVIVDSPDSNPGPNLQVLLTTLHSVLPTAFGFAPRPHFEKWEALSIAQVLSKEHIAKPMRKVRVRFGVLRKIQPVIRYNVPTEVDYKLTPTLVDSGCHLTN